MKNSHKGFAIPIIIAIVAVLAIGGGAYYYTQQNNADAPGDEIPLNNESGIKNTNTVTISGTYEERSDKSLCFFADSKSKSKLPRPGGDPRVERICFGNQDEAKRTFGLDESMLETGACSKITGNAKIQISGFKYVTRAIEADSYDTAKLEKVISKSGEAKCVTENTTSVTDQTAGWLKYGGVAEKFEIKYPSKEFRSANRSDSLVGIRGDIIARPEYFEGTNLSAAYVEIIKKDNVASCTANIFLENSANGIKSLQSIIKNNIAFTVAATSDTAAGSTYSRTAYSTSGNGLCYGIIFSTQVGNLGAYSQGVKAYDAVKLNSIFDGILSTFRMLK